MTNLFVVGALCALTISCVSPQIADQPRVDSDQIRIQHKIELACLGSGLFKKVNTIALAAVPYGELGATLVNAGVDVVCARPEVFARDISTIEWLYRHFRDEMAKRNAKVVCETVGDLKCV